MFENAFLKNSGYSNIVFMLSAFSCYGSKDTIPCVCDIRPRQLQRPSVCPRSMWPSRSEEQI